MNLKRFLFLSLLPFVQTLLRDTHPFLLSSSAPIHLLDWDLEKYHAGIFLSPNREIILESDRSLMFTDVIQPLQPGGKPLHKHKPYWLPSFSLPHFLSQDILSCLLPSSGWNLLHWLSPSSRPSDSDWSYTICSPWSPACRLTLQILWLVSLHVM